VPEAATLKELEWPVAPLASLAARILPKTPVPRKAPKLSRLCLEIFPSSPTKKLVILFFNSGNIIK